MAVLILIIIHAFQIFSLVRVKRINAVRLFLQIFFFQTSQTQQDLTLALITFSQKTIDTSEAFSIGHTKNIPVQKHSKPGNISFTNSWQTNIINYIAVSAWGSHSPSPLKAGITR